MKRCKEEGCERKSRVRGWCQMHYQRWYAQQPAKFPCRVSGCEKKGRRIRELCDMHYRRLRKHGDVNTKLKPGFPHPKGYRKGIPRTKHIRPLVIAGRLAYVPLPNHPQPAVIDAIDAPLVSQHNWVKTRTSKTGEYVATNIPHLDTNGYTKFETVYLQRMILQTTPEQRIHFSNLNAFDCRRVNLLIDGEPASTYVKGVTDERTHQPRRRTKAGKEILLRRHEVQSGSRR